MYTVEHSKIDTFLTKKLKRQEKLRITCQMTNIFPEEYPKNRYSGQKDENFGITDIPSLFPYDDFTDEI